MRHTLAACESNYLYSRYHARHLVLHRFLVKRIPSRVHEALQQGRGRVMKHDNPSRDRAMVLKSYLYEFDRHVDAFEFSAVVRRVGEHPVDGSRKVSRIWRVEVRALRHAIDRQDELLELRGNRNTIQGRRSCHCGNLTKLTKLTKLVNGVCRLTWSTVSALALSQALCQARPDCWIR